MTQLSYQIPILGNPASSEDPKIHDALQQIETVVNGGLDSGNIADGSIAGADLVPAEAWHLVGGAGEPAFQNSWVNNGGAGFPVMQFKKTINGIVLLEGVIKSGANSTVAFTLPVGYRPASTLYLPLSHGWTGSVNTITRVQVLANGNVSVATDAGSTTEVHVIGSFLAEQ